MSDLDTEILAKIDAEEKGEEPKGASDTDDSKVSSTSEETESDLGDSENKGTESESEESTKSDTGGSSEGLPADLQKDIETYKKRTEDTRKYATSVKNALLSTSKTLEELVKAGDIDDQTHQKIVEALKIHTHSEPETLRESVKEKKEDNIFAPLHTLIDQEIINQYCDVTEDKSVDSKLTAFDHLTASMNKQEQIDLLAKMLDGKPSSMAVLKRVLAEGEAFLKDGFDEAISQGSLRNFIKQQKQEKKSLLEQIDKLKKQVDNYKNNFEEGASFDFGSSSQSSASDKGGSFKDKDEAILARLDKEDTRKARIPYAL
jgi:hypothetical protein